MRVVERGTQLSIIFDMGLRENVENRWSSAVVPNLVPAGIFLPRKPFSMPIRQCFKTLLPQLSFYKGCDLKDQYFDLKD